MRWAVKMLSRSILKHSFLMDDIPAKLDCLKSCDIIPDVTESDRKSENITQGRESQRNCPSVNAYPVGLCGLARAVPLAFL